MNELSINKTLNRFSTELSKAGDQESIRSIGKAIAGSKKQGNLRGVQEALLSNLRWQYRKVMAIAQGGCECGHCNGAGFMTHSTWLAKHKDGLCFQCQGRGYVVPTTSSNTTVVTVEAKEAL